MSSIDLSLVYLSFNNPDAILTAIRFLKVNDLPTYEILVVDDGSRSECLAALQEGLNREFSGLNLTLLTKPTQKGICHSLNLALENAAGRTFCAIGDDWISASYLKAAAASILKEHSDIDFIYSDCEWISPDGRVLKESHLAQFGLDPAQPPKDRLLRSILLRRNVVPAPSLVIRTSRLKEIGQYDEDLLYEDWDILLRLSADGNGQGLPLNQIKYVRYSSNTSGLLNGANFVLSTILLLAKQIQAKADPVTQKLQLRITIARQVLKWHLRVRPSRTEKSEGARLLKKRGHPVLALLVRL
jgi:glycosyltransferase involved in cell wall biosynthesis